MRIQQHLTDAPLSDAILVKRLRAGDGEVLRDLYVRHGSATLRLAYQLTGSLPDAEDIAQDVFIGLQHALRSYTEQGQFPGWLSRVTTRVVLVRQRRRGGRVEVPLDDVDEVIALPSEPVIERIALEQAIATLPLSLRQVFVLFEIERYTHAEIAALLEIRRGTSEVRLYRAIRRLRTCLGDSSK